MPARNSTATRRIHVSNAGTLSGRRKVSFNLLNRHDSGLYPENLNFSVRKDPRLSIQMAGFNIDPQHAYLFGSFQVRDYDDELLSNWPDNLFLVPATVMRLNTQLRLIGKYFYRATIVDGRHEKQLLDFVEHPNDHGWLDSMFSSTDPSRPMSPITVQQLDLNVFETATVLRLNVSRA